MLGGGPSRLFREAARYGLRRGQEQVALSSGSRVHRYNAVTTWKRQSVYSS